MAAASIILDCTALAEELVARPVGDVTTRRQRCEELTQRLEAEARSTVAGGRYLDNFAPLLLQAIDRALYHRHCANEAQAVKFDAVVGHLLPHARDDAAAAMSSMSERGDR